MISVKYSESRNSEERVSERRVLGGFPVTNTAKVITASTSIYENKHGKIDVFKIDFVEDVMQNGDYAVLYSWDKNAAHLVLYSLRDRCTYLRMKDGGTWSSWQKIAADIPEFYKSYSDLSSLASALGVTRIASVTDANDLPDGFYKGYGLTNAPTLSTLVYETHSLDADDKVQIAYRTLNGECYQRGKSDGSWGSWYKHSVDVK